MSVMAPQAHCERCGRVVPVGLRRITCSNGAIAVFQVCLQTAKPHRLTKDGRNVSHGQAGRWGLRVEDIPELEYRPEILCEVAGCQNPGAELHHWAPKELFGVREANDWPTSLLCKPHHDRWYQAVKDFYGVNRAKKPLERSGVPADMIRSTAPREPLGGPKDQQQEAIHGKGDETEYA